MLGKQAERTALLSSEMRSPSAHRLPSALGREGRPRRCWGWWCSWVPKHVSDPSSQAKKSSLDFQNREESQQDHGNLPSTQ